MLTQERIKELLEYREGKLYWKESRGRTKAGTEAGTKDSKGYMRTQIDKQRYANHRLIFTMHYGYTPNCVDHIDGNTLNNHIENLRAATISENQYNRTLSKNNTSGAKGVFWNKHYQLWQAGVNFNKRQYFAGRYTNIADAIQAVINKRNQLHKGFANHG